MPRNVHLGNDDGNAATPSRSRRNRRNRRSFTLRTEPTAASTATGTPLYNRLPQSNRCLAFCSRVTGIITYPCLILISVISMALVATFCIFPTLLVTSFIICCYYCTMEDPIPLTVLLRYMFFSDPDDSGVDFQTLRAHLGQQRPAIQSKLIVRKVISVDENTSASTKEKTRTYPRKHPKSIKIWTDSKRIVYSEPIVLEEDDGDKTTSRGEADDAIAAALAFNTSDAAAHQLPHYQRPIPYFPSAIEPIAPNHGAESNIRGIDMTTFSARFNPATATMETATDAPPTASWPTDEQVQVTWPISLLEDDEVSANRDDSDANANDYSEENEDIDSCSSDEQQDTSSAVQDTPTSLVVVDETLEPPAISTNNDETTPDDTLTPQSGTAQAAENTTVDDIEDGAGINSDIEDDDDDDDDDDLWSLCSSSTVSTETRDDRNYNNRNANDDDDEPLEDDDVNDSAHSSQMRVDIATLQHPSSQVASSSENDADAEGDDDIDDMDEEAGHVIEKKSASIKQGVAITRTSFTGGLETIVEGDQDEVTERSRRFDNMVTDLTDQVVDIELGIATVPQNVEETLEEDRVATNTGESNNNSANETKMAERSTAAAAAVADSKDDPEAQLEAGKDPQEGDEDWAADYFGVEESRDRGTACDICLLAFEVDDLVAWSPNKECTHSYHKDCILDWLIRKPTCPNCRHNYIKGKNGDCGNA